MTCFHCGGGSTGQRRSTQTTIVRWVARRTHTTELLYLSQERADLRVRSASLSRPHRGSAGPVQKLLADLRAVARLTASETKKTPFHLVLAARNSASRDSTYSKNICELEVSKVPPWGVGQDRPSRRHTFEPQVVFTRPAGAEAHRQLADSSHDRAGLSLDRDRTRRVADPFHVVAPANHHFDKVKRRLQKETLGTEDAQSRCLYRIRKLFLSAHERLDEVGHLAGAAPRRRVTSPSPHTPSHPDPLSHSTPSSP